ncbi:MAG: hypothetical protein Q8O59_00350 [bacterium]|nr:hypothetical protein [bacterium]
MNKREELKSAKFFVDWLNKKYGYNYMAISNDNENKSDTEIDIYATSNNMGLQPLNLQLVTSEGKMFKEFALLRKKSKKTGNGVVRGNVIDLDSMEWIKSAIELKEKKYPKDVKKSMVLLIQKDIWPLFDESYFNNHFQNYKTSDFKGIYLVHTPKESSSHPHDGQILAIKGFKTN